MAIKICQKIWGMEMVKCNNHETKKVESCKFLGSKIVANGNVKEETTERTKVQESFTN